MIEASKQAEILQLYYTEKLSIRKIARQVGVNRKTVKKIIEHRGVILSPQKYKKRSSILEPFYPKISKLLDVAPDRSCVNILQHLRDAGYCGGITILRDYINTIRPKEISREPFLKLDFLPGEAAQVDWGEFGDVFNNGTKVHVFVMVLCWSRMLYLEFTHRENLPCFLRCYERALKFFGGRCKEYWHDNMLTVVLERIENLYRFNPEFYAYSSFHGFKPVLCGKGKGNEKGRVEDGVKLIKQQFWPGRSFKDLDDINNQGTIWRDRYANRREHEVTGKIPELMLEQEKSSLISLRPEPYETDDVDSCTVSKFFRIRFDTNTYTVPSTLVGKTLTIRGNDKQVKVYYGPKKVTTYDREYRKKQDIVNPRHQEEVKELKKSASRTWQIETLKSLGPNTSRYLDMIHSGQRSIRSEIKELFCLSTVYGKDSIEATIGEMLQKGIVGCDRLEQLLRRKHTKNCSPPPLNLNDEKLQFVPPLPNLHEYDEYLLDAMNDNHTNDKEE